RRLKGRVRDAAAEGLSAHDRLRVEVGPPGEADGGRRGIENERFNLPAPSHFSGKSGAGRRGQGGDPRPSEAAREFEGAVERQMQAALRRLTTDSRSASRVEWVESEGELVAEVCEQAEDLYRGLDLEQLARGTVPSTPVDAL
ncbi:hypothetical protein H632_c4911p0, partial [Helicosporidium sp. ATCC 50920]